MRKIDYWLKGSVPNCHDAAIVLPGEDARATLVESVIGTISTDVFVRLGDVEIHLAALMDPDHWSADWAELGVDEAEVDDLIAGLVT